MLYLDINGLELQLNLNQFREDLLGESEYDNWCYMDFAVMRNGVNIYHNCKNMPWLTYDEIKSIRDTIANVKNGVITQDKRLIFIERDIEFEFKFNEGEFSYADMILGYWKTDGRDVLTGNRLVLCLDIYNLEQILCYLQYKTDADYDEGLFEEYCAKGVIKKAPDKLSFKIINGEIALGEMSKIKGVIGIFINDREILDIVADMENEKLEGGAMDYIHQTASELYGNLVPNDALADWQKENGAEILSCTCGIIEDGSPTVFIEKDERNVYWKALGHNQIEYNFPLKYVFDRRQYEQALEELKKFVEDINIY